LNTTSGSTGKPLEFYQSEYDRKVIHECYCRLYRFLPKTSYRAIAIRHFDSSDKDTDPLRVISYTPTRCSKTKIVHKFRFLSSKETCDRLAEIIWREQPGLLTGFISAIYLAARVLLKQNRALESVEAICPCGEYICESYRPVIAEAFPRAKIYDRYGVQELGTLAWECPLCGKYHFNSDFFAFHPIGDDRFAISKRFISGFQLVNYDVGDHLRFVGIGECEINLPTIEILEGRRDDILIDEKGKPLPIMPYHLGGMKELIQWQIIQQPDLSLDVNAIVEKETCDIAQQLEKHIRQSLRDFKLPIRIHFVRQITTTRKLKRVISNVQHDI
jgi:phenylacetate-coenzyme A ligase PaaK-like adenylate-forming protein